MKNIALLFSIFVLALGICFAPRSGLTYTSTPTPSVGVNGKIVYVGNSDILVMNADGSNKINLTNTRSNNNDPVWSPDGTKIAFQTTFFSGGDPDIAVMNADGTGLTRLTMGFFGDETPAWSPDGTKIAFAGNLDQSIESIFVMNADGSNVTRITNAFPASDAAPAWSPDGSRIAFHTNEGAIGLHIAIVNADGTGRTGLAPTAFGLFPAWSPDGTKIAFSGDIPGEGERIVVMNPDGAGQTQLTNSAFADSNPAWSPDGTKIAFDRHLNGQRQVFAMNVDGTGQTDLTSGSAFFDNNRPDWQRVTAPNTPMGSNVVVRTSDANVTFSNVSVAGTTTFTPITPNPAELPAGYTLCPTCPAYDIATTATYTPPVTVCLAVPASVTPQDYLLLKLMHSENGAFVDHTTGHFTDSGIRFVCGVVQSLSPFALASSAGPTSASVSVGGRVLTSNGRGISKVYVSITNQNGETQTVLTNPFGYYRFNEIPIGETYLITLANKRYQFANNPQVITVMDEIRELNFTAEP